MRERKSAARAAAAVPDERLAAAYLLPIVTGFGLERLTERFYSCDHRVKNKGNSACN
jgi:hypothetical protein